MMFVIEIFMLSACTCVTLSYLLRVSLLSYVDCVYQIVFFFNEYGSKIVATIHRPQCLEPWFGFVVASLQKEDASCLVKVLTYDCCLCLVSLKSTSSHIVTSNVSNAKQIATATCVRFCNELVCDVDLVVPYNINCRIELHCNDNTPL